MRRLIHGRTRTRQIEKRFIEQCRWLNPTMTPVWCVLSAICYTDVIFALHGYTLDRGMGKTGSDLVLWSSLSLRQNGWLDNHLVSLSLCYQQYFKGYFLDSLTRTVSISKAFVLKLDRGPDALLCLMSL